MSSCGRGYGYAFGVPGGMEDEDDDCGFFFGDELPAREDDSYFSNYAQGASKYNDNPEHDWKPHKQNSDVKVAEPAPVGVESWNRSTNCSVSNTMTVRGVAAGYEDSDEDDDFYFGDDPPNFSNKSNSYQNVMSHAHAQFQSGHHQTPVASYVNQADDSGGMNSAVQSGTNVKGSIFSKKAVQQNISEDVSLQGENVRMAIVKGNIEYIRKALNAGFKPESKIKSGWTALIYAAHSGFPEIVDILIEFGSNANFQKDMFTPLMAVCTSTRNVEEDLMLCAEKIISAGGRINAHDRHLMTPLMYASQNGRPELVRLLISKGADMNKQDTRGWTALSFAANSGYTHVVKVLLQNKAKSELCATDGQSPADLAYAQGFSALAKILEGSSEVSVEKLGEMPPTSGRKHMDSRKSQGSRYVKYGDLELFLCGIELGHLVPLFQEHELSFQDFLKITDKDLMQIGITQLGVRQKILEAVRGIHTNEWDLSSLKTDKVKLSTLEAAAIIANVTKHLTCIQSSVDYLKDYIEESKAYIKEDDPSLQRTLCQQCKEATDAAVSLEQKLTVLQQDLGRQLPKAKQRPPDLIDERSIPTTDSNRSRLFLLATGTFLLGIGSVLAYSALKDSVS